MGWVFGNGEEGMLFCVGGEGSIFTVEQSQGNVNFSIEWLPEKDDEEMI